MGGLICSGQDFGGHGGGIEGLQESPPFMTTRPSHNIINGFLKLTNKNSAAIGENPGRKKYLRLHQNMSIKQCRELLRTIIAESVNCFKQQFGNFSKIVHVSSQNLLKPSQRKQFFGIVLSDLCDKVGLPLKNSEYHSTKICNTCSRKILKVH
jgi:hypothetical protein